MKLTRLHPPQPNVDHDQILSWVERVALFFANQGGLPMITGRILGWLMICDPSEQSGAEIAEAIGASRASITTGMRLLTATQLVHPLSRPGERTVYYRIDDDAWEKVIRRKMEIMTAFLEVAQDGMHLVGAATPRAARIRAAHDIYRWAATAFGNAPEPPSTKRNP